MPSQQLYSHVSTCCTDYNSSFSPNAVWCSLIFKQKDAMQYLLQCLWIILILNSDLWVHVDDEAASQELVPRLNLVSAKVFFLHLFSLFFIQSACYKALRYIRLIWLDHQSWLMNVQKLYIIDLNAHYKSETWMQFFLIFGFFCRSWNHNEHDDLHV